MTNQSAHKINILLVDDRADKLTALEAALESLNQNIVKVNSGTEALRALLHEDFAVILLDVSMPGMDGFQTASLIRQRIRSEHTPIIFVTSINTNETHVSQGYSLGAVDYVFSPVEPEILRAKVAVFIDLFKKSEQIKEQAEMLRQAAEVRASYLENRMRGLFNRLNVGLFKADLKGQFIQKNPAFDRLFKIGTLDEESGFNLHRLWPELDKFLLESDMETTDKRESEWIYPDGSSAWLAVTLSRGQRPDGMQYIEGMIEDVSTRKRNEELLLTMNETLERKVRERSEALRQSQEHLRRSERLASLGTLAAGIAHEINNPLNSILMSSDFAKRNLGKPEIINQTLSVISDNTKRCGRIIKGVLQFARNQKTLKTAHELNSLVKNAADLMKTYIQTPLQINFNLSEEDLSVNANQTELEQVIVNILQNAADASSNGSLIININTRKQGNTAELSIGDNGPGIPAEIMDKIFDPFFTTRNGNGGTGLGLSVAHGIVSDHGGSLKVKNLSKGGAVFTINLPFFNSSESLSNKKNISEGEHVF
jgi:PAS domain S-box-containing protein